MKSFLYIATFLFDVLILFTFWGCLKDNPVDDAQKIAALRNVTLQYDSLEYEIGLPEGALDGKSFDELRAQEPEKYNNLQNYTISFILNMTADNTNCPSIFINEG